MLAQLAFWDNGTLAVAYSRGRVQLWDVGMYRRRRSAGAIAPPFLSSASTSFVSAEWIAHDGPITSMTARPAARKMSPLPSSPSPSTTTTAAATTATSTTTASPAAARRGGGQTGHRHLGDEVAADVVVGGDAHTHLLLSRRTPAVATGGGDGMVRVWTDEGMAYYGSGGGASSRTGGGGSGASTPAAGRSGHEGAVLCVCWHPGGDLLASTGQDWAIWLWNAEGRALSYIHAHQRWTRVLSFSDGGDFLASYATGGGFAGWSVAVTENRQVFTIRWKHPRKLIATHAEVSSFLFFGV